MSPNTRRITENLARVRERIAAAAARAGRSASEITLIGVTKYVGADEAAALADAGCLDLGESRPQELWRKAESLAGRGIRWHLIGHLQSNKARRTLPLVHLLHSGDSQRLLEQLHATGAGSPCHVLLEVNISGDATKHGFRPEELLASFPSLCLLTHLEPRGLMTLSGLESTPDQTRAEFARLRTLRDELRRLAPAHVRLDELSMGMSDDFEIAIEEGATLVRVGSALWEGCQS